MGIFQYIALKVIAGLVQSGPLNQASNNFSSCFGWAGTDVKTGGLCSWEPSAAVGAPGRERGERRRRLSTDGLGDRFVEAKILQNKKPFPCLNSNDRDGFRWSGASFKANSLRV